MLLETKTNKQNYAFHSSFIYCSSRSPYVRDSEIKRKYHSVISYRKLIVLKNQDRKGFPLKVLFMNSANSTLQQIKCLVFKVSFGGIFFFNSFLKYTCDLFHKYENARENAFFSHNNKSIDKNTKIYNMRS